MKTNKTCVLCGNKYYYCNSGCKESLNKPSWMGAFCCDNCKMIFDVCSSYNMKKVTVEEARNILDKCDLSEKSHFTPTTQKIINEIIELTNVVEDVIEIIEIDESEEVAKATTRKRKKKIDSDL